MHFLCNKRADVVILIDEINRDLNPTHKLDETNLLLAELKEFENTERKEEFEMWIYELLNRVDNSSVD